MVIKNENCDSHYLPLRVLSHPADSRSTDQEGRFDHLSRSPCIAYALTARTGIVARQGFSRILCITPKPSSTGMPMSSSSMSG
jgi:hypothetical protein